MSNREEQASEARQREAQRGENRYDEDRHEEDHRFQQSPEDRAEVDQRRVEKAIRRAREKARQREAVERKNERKAENEREAEQRRQEMLRRTAVGGNGHSGSTDGNGNGGSDGSTGNGTSGVTDMFEYGYRTRQYGPDELITDAHGNPISVAEAMLDAKTAAATPTSTPHLAFYSPRIPGNTGSAIRLCAVTGTILHLIEPLGFNLKDTKLRRAGLDYHDMAHVVIHPNFEEMADSMPNSRIIAFTAHATKLYTDVEYRPDDILLFGPEPGNIPDPLDIMFGPRVAEQVRLPMRPALRSLNLTNTASIAIYEAWRQLGFKGGK